MAYVFLARLRAILLIFTIIGEVYFAGGNYVVPYALLSRSLLTTNKPVIQHFTSPKYVNSRLTMTPFSSPLSSQVVFYEGSVESDGSSL